MAALTCGTAETPWTATSRISNRTCGQRARALTTTSCSALDSRPQTSPTTRGRKGSGFLRPRSKSPSAASTRLRCSMRASSSPTPTGLSWSACSWKEPRLVQKVGLARTATCAPSSIGAVTASRTFAYTETGRDMSASVSRSVKNAMPAPGRRLSCTT